MKKCFILFFTLLAFLVVAAVIENTENGKMIKEELSISEENTINEFVHQ